MIDYKTIFEVCPANYMILLPDDPKFTIVAVTDHHLVLLRRKRESLVGFGLFECYPANPAFRWDESRTRQLHQSLADVIKYRLTQDMIARYDVYNDIKGAFEERFWSITNIPIMDADRLRGILNTSVDITAIYVQGFRIEPIK